jgi:hypothetical protein
MVSKAKVLSELIEKGVEGSGRGLILGIIPVLSWWKSGGP